MTYQIQGFGINQSLPITRGITMAESDDFGYAETIAKALAGAYPTEVFGVRNTISGQVETWCNKGTVRWDGI